MHKRPKMNQNENENNLKVWLPRENMSFKVYTTSAILHHTKGELAPELVTRQKP
jgi:hypothetical protein